MSRLKELRLHGFKSFADPTRFVFEPGVNAVIGPNGSGKSNMADAVRWVLGEQSNRSLRTRRADDVIFAGSDSRRAQGMAEAILTLDNSDGWLPIEYAEVSIGRRAYRSGESEYLINGARARLRDVVALLGEGRLGANELVVVGQGTVDAALSLRPEERRQLFEEAAGVKGFQVRRNEASGRLARALDNLTRVADLVGELRPQVRRLAQQAAHQQQHDTLGAHARALVIEAHRRREREARTALGEARRTAAAAETALEAHRDEQAQGRRVIAAAEERYWQAEEAARRAAGDRERTRETLIRAETRLEALAARFHESESAVTDAEAGLEAARAELEDLSATAGEAPAAPHEALAVAERRWRAAVDDLAAADAALLGAEDALAEARRRQSGRIAAEARRSEGEVRTAARRERIAEELTAARAAATDAEAMASSSARAAGDAETRRTDARRQLEVAAAARDAAQVAHDGARQRVAELAERASLMRAELNALEERSRDPERLGQRLARAGWPSLLDALDAPEAAWPAIEALVGGELDQALLWHGEDPADAMREARGAARILDTGGGDPPGRDEAMSAVGGRRTLADWVANGATPSVFARTVVAPSVDALLAGWRRLPRGWGAVTAEGDLADERGLLVLRGRGEAPAGAAARDRRRRRDLAEALAELERQRTAAASDAHAAADALRSARDAHLAARDADDAAQRRIREALDALAAGHAARRRSASEVARLEAELAALPPSDDAPSRSATPAGDGEWSLDALQARAVAARDRRQRAAEQRDAARDAWSEARAAAEESERGTAGRRERMAALAARIVQAEAEVPSRASARAALATDRDAAEAELRAARDADGRAADASQAAEERRSRLRTELLELERAGGGTAARLAELERAWQSAAVEATRRDEALGALLRERDLALEGLPDGSGATADMADVLALGDDALDAELRRVRRVLAQIGSVNPFAVEEHRELSGRLTELSGQESDLRAAIASTEELIGTLDAEIASQFDTAFRSIGERFDEYCRLLFAGGSGSLQIADATDGDAPGGIEIVVRPPGKRLQRLAMLSGGERALAGVALLFAMLTVNPVPFCILDEVDAALDEANIGRFAEALRRLADAIDFVVITHNRATIEVADTIYGVTMTDAAVSRLLSLRLADLPVGVSA